MVDTIPHDLVVHPRRHTASHRKNQLPVEGFLKQLQDLPTLGIVGEVGDSCGSWDVLAVPRAVVHTVGDDNGLVLFEALASLIAGGDAHVTFGLVAGHVPEDGHADGALGPLLLADELY